MTPTKSNWTNCPHCGGILPKANPQLPGRVSSEAEDKDAELFFEVVEALRQSRVNLKRSADYGARTVTSDYHFIEKIDTLLLKCTPEKIKQYEASRSNEARMRDLLDKLLNLYDPGPWPTSDVIGILHDACEATGTRSPPQTQEETTT